MGKFFEDFGERIAQTAETLTDKAGDVVEITRIKNLIRGLKQENFNDIKELGNFVYEQYKNKEALPENLVGLCEAIEAREKNIEKYREKICEVKGEKMCRSCGKYSPKDTLYCPYCGTKLSDPEKDKAEDMAEEVKDKAEDMAEKAKDKAEDVAKEVKDKAEDMAEKVKDKAEDIADKVEDIAGKIKDKAESAAENVCDRVSDILKKQG